MNTFPLGKTAKGEILSLSTDDRRRHLYIIGKSGTGKSTLLFNLMAADLENGRGFVLLDPHGDLAQSVADSAPTQRTNDILYVNPSDLSHSVGFNPLADIEPDYRPLAADHIVASFRNIWRESWGPRMEYILLNAVRLLLDTPRSTLLGLPRLLLDARYREALLKNSCDPIVRSFWADEYDRYTDAFRKEAIAPIQNKVGALLSIPTIRHILGQERSTLNIADIMNRGKVVILNLSKGKLGEQPAHLLGALVITAVVHAAESRAAIQEHERRDFTLYTDEFQNFATDSFADILSESRKWRLSLVLANQFLGHIPERIQDAIIGNAGTLVAFRTGAKDAPLLAAELGIDNPRALTDLSNYAAWVKLIQHGVPTNPMQVSTFPHEPTAANRLPAIIARTRARHARSREVIEAQIARFLARA